ncbi:MAG: sulfite exporter TauE/SafE family protein [Desulfobacteraceae bacterium]|nr:sulfite exporter TauE/SafE family protein [Desulfobacteraceae bacterium]
MIWSLYSPIAGFSVNIFLLLGLGGSVGFLSGLSGVGGGFLLTPLLIMAGIPPTVAAATDSNQIVASATSGAYAHYRMGSVDFKMGLLIFTGGLVGSTVGVEIIKFMREVGEVDFFIEITYVVLLGILGFFMMADSINCLLKKRGIPGSVEKSKKRSFHDHLFQALPWKMRFDKSGVTLSPILPVLAGGFAGMVAAILGVGGGFIMLPTMCYVLRMPMHVVVGTNLFQEVLVCANITAMQAITNHTVDLALALILLSGSTVGAQFGARLGHKLNADYLKLVLASVVLLVMVKILVELTFSPDLMLGIKGER